MEIDLQSAFATCQAKGQVFCFYSEMMLLPDFKKGAKLPEGETVPVEFMPDRTGEFEFQCQMGMLRGKLIVA